MSPIRGSRRSCGRFEKSYVPTANRHVQTVTSRTDLPIRTNVTAAGTRKAFPGKIGSLLPHNLTQAFHDFYPAIISEFACYPGKLYRRRCLGLIVRGWSKLLRAREPGAERRRDSGSGEVPRC